MPLSNEEIATRFSYHAPKEGQPEIYESLRFGGRELAHKINELCPDSREKALALTHLEQALFWANAAVARNG
jgi:hypothetical protein